MPKSLPMRAVTAFCVAMLVPAVGQAQETASARVSYADLNLASSYGQRILQSRIVFAATSLCDPVDEFSLELRHAVLNCRTSTIADAQPAFQAAVSQALHPSVTVLDAAALIVAVHR